MQATDRIRDGTKRQATRVTAASFAMKQVAQLHQKPVPNIYANNSFSRLFSSIIETVTTMSQNSDKK